MHHQKFNVRCNTVMSALENLRDAHRIDGPPAMVIHKPPPLPDISVIFTEAEGYVREGISECTCPLDTESQRIINCAAGLLGDGGGDEIDDDGEYTRAIHELTRDILGIENVQYHIDVARGVLAARR